MLTSAQLKEALHYDPGTGVFIWRQRIDKSQKWNERFAGNPAGYVRGRGYLGICLFNKSHYAHQLAWLFMNGDLPDIEVDHINGIKTDNRWSNLRLATHSQNGANRGADRDNSHGYKGVARNGRHWQAKIVVNQKAIYLGNFSDPAAAHEVYAEAAKKHFGDFARSE